MSQKRKPHLKGKSVLPVSTGRSKKVKQPTQKPEMQPVMVMGPTGKLVMEKRPW